jgi:hypothetical protein
MPSDPTVAELAHNRSGRDELQTLSEQIRARVDKHLERLKAFDDD